MKIFFSNKDLVPNNTTREEILEQPLSARFSTEFEYPALFYPAAWRGKSGEIFVFLKKSCT